MSTHSTEPTDTTDDDSLPTAVELLRRRAENKPNVIALSDPPNRRELRPRQRAGVDLSRDRRRRRCARRLLRRPRPRPRRCHRGAAPQFRACAADDPRRLARRAYGRALADAVAGIRDRQGLRRSRAQGADRRLLFRRRDPDRDACRGRRGAVLDPLRARLRPHLPDGIASLDEAMNGSREPAAVEAPASDRTGARHVHGAGRARPSCRSMRNEEELLAQGAMTVLALDLDSRDVILNPYPLTGPAGLSLGLMPWLSAAPRSPSIIPSTTALRRAGHRHGGDGDRAAGARSSPQLANDGVPQAPQCRLRRAGAVWTGLEQASPLPVPFGGERRVLRSLSARRSRRASCSCARGRTIPLRFPWADRNPGWRGRRRLRGDEACAATRPRRIRRDRLARADRSRRAGRGAACARRRRLHRHRPSRQGRGDGRHVPSAQGRPRASPSRRACRSPLPSSTSFTEASPPSSTPPVSCFPIRKSETASFAAVVPLPDEPVTLEALNRFLEERRVAPYKFPDKIVIVRQIPRDAEGRVLREQILLASLRRVRPPASPLARS